MGRILVDAVRTKAGAGDLPPHTLPTQLTSFIGRGQEVAILTRLLGDARLVTVTGTGGAGKTRMAIEVARDWELLQKTMAESDSPVASHIQLRSENIRGNRP